MADQPTPKDPVVAKFEGWLEQAKTSPFASTETMFYEKALNSYLEKKSRKATPGNTNELAGAAFRAQDMNEQIDRIERARPDEAARIRNLHASVLREDDRMVLLQRAAKRQGMELPYNTNSPEYGEALQKTEQDIVDALLAGQTKPDAASPLYYTPARPGVEVERPAVGVSLTGAADRLPASTPAGLLLKALVARGAELKPGALRDREYQERTAPEPAPQPSEAFVGPLAPEIDEDAFELANIYAMRNFGREYESHEDLLQNFAADYNATRDRAVELVESTLTAAAKDTAEYNLKGMVYNDVTGTVMPMEAVPKLGEVEAEQLAAGLRPEVPVRNVFRDTADRDYREKVTAGFEAMQAGEPDQQEAFVVGADRARGIRNAFSSFAGKRRVKDLYVPMMYDPTSRQFLVDVQAEKLALYNLYKQTSLTKFEIENERTANAEEMEQIKTAAYEKALGEVNRALAVQRAPLYHRDPAGDQAAYMNKEGWWSWAAHSTGFTRAAGALAIATQQAGGRIVFDGQSYARSQPGIFGSMLGEGPKANALDWTIRLWEPLSSPIGAALGVAHEQLIEEEGGVSDDRYVHGYGPAKVLAKLWEVWDSDEHLLAMFEARDTGASLLTELPGMLWGHGEEEETDIARQAARSATGLITFAGLMLEPGPTEYATYARFGVGKAGGVSGLTQTLGKIRSDQVLARMADKLEKGAGGLDEIRNAKPSKLGEELSENAGENVFTRMRKAAQRDVEGEASIPLRFAQILTQMQLGYRAKREANLVSALRDNYKTIQQTAEGHRKRLSGLVAKLEKQAKADPARATTEAEIAAAKIQIKMAELQAMRTQGRILRRNETFKRKEYNAEVAMAANIEGASNIRKSLEALLEELGGKVRTRRKTVGRIEQYLDQLEASDLKNLEGYFQAKNVEINKLRKELREAYPYGGTKSTPAMRKKRKAAMRKVKQLLDAKMETGAAERLVKIGEQMKDASAARKIFETKYQKLLVSAAEEWNVLRKTMGLDEVSARALRSRGKKPMLSRKGADKLRRDLATARKTVATLGREHLAVSDELTMAKEVAEGTQEVYDEAFALFKNNLLNTLAIARTGGKNKEFVRRMQRMYEQGYMVDEAGEVLEDAASIEKAAQDPEFIATLRELADPQLASASAERLTAMFMGDMNLMMQMFRSPSATRMKGIRGGFISFAQLRSGNISAALALAEPFGTARAFYAGALAALGPGGRLEILSNLFKTDVRLNGVATNKRLDDMAKEDQRALGEKTADLARGILYITKKGRLEQSAPEVIATEQRAFARRMMTESELGDPLIDPFTGEEEVLYSLAMNQRADIDEAIDYMLNSCLGRRAETRTAPLTGDEVFQDPAIHGIVRAFIDDDVFVKAQKTGAATPAQGARAALDLLLTSLREIADVFPSMSSAEKLSLLEDELVSAITKAFGGNKRAINLEGAQNFNLFTKSIMQAAQRNRSTRSLFAVARNMRPAMGEALMNGFLLDGTYVPPAVADVPLEVGNFVVPASYVRKLNSVAGQTIKRGEIPREVDVDARVVRDQEVLVQKTVGGQQMEPALDPLVGRLDRPEREVLEGDTLATIARGLGLKRQDIAELNGLAIDAELTPGTMLKLPSDEVPYRLPGVEGRVTAMRPKQIKKIATDGTGARVAILEDGTAIPTKDLTRAVDDPKTVAIALMEAVVGWGLKTMDNETVVNGLVSRFNELAVINQRMIAHSYDPVTGAVRMIPRDYLSHFENVYSNFNKVYTEEMLKTNQGRSFFNIVGDVYDSATRFFRQSILTGLGVVPRFEYVTNMHAGDMSQQLLMDRSLSTRKLLGNTARFGAQGILAYLPKYGPAFLAMMNKRARRAAAKGKNGQPPLHLAMFNAPIDLVLEASDELLPLFGGASRSGREVLSDFLRGGGRDNIMSADTGDLLETAARRMIKGIEDESGGVLDAAIIAERRAKMGGVERMRAGAEDKLVRVAVSEVVTQAERLGYATKLMNKAIREGTIRQRLWVYLNHLQNVDASHKAAKKAMDDTLYDWKYSASPLEIATLGRLAIFYVFFKNMLAQTARSAVDMPSSSLGEHFRRYKTFPYVFTGGQKLKGLLRWRQYQLDKQLSPDREEVMTDEQSAIAALQGKLPEYLGTYPIFGAGTVPDSIKEAYEELGILRSFMVRTMPRPTAIDAMKTYADIIILAGATAATVTEAVGLQDSVSVSGNEMLNLVSDMIDDYTYGWVSQGANAALGGLGDEPRILSRRGKRVNEGDLLLLNLFGLQDTLMVDNQGAMRIDPGKMGIPVGVTYGLFSSFLGPELTRGQFLAGMVGAPELSTPMIRSFQGEYGRLSAMLEAVWQYTGILKARFYYAQGEQFYAADAVKKDFARIKNQAKDEYKTAVTDLDIKKRQKRKKKRKKRKGD